MILIICLNLTINMFSKQIKRGLNIGNNVDVCCYFCGLMGHEEDSCPLSKCEDLGTSEELGP